MALQASKSVPDDGIINATTWGLLQVEIQLLSQSELNDGSAIDSYGFAEVACADQVLFYQDIRISDHGVSLDRVAWTQSRNQPNSAEAIPFSIDSPYNVL